MPPEFLDNWEKYNRTPPIDVYSFAMILYSIWTEKEPFEGQSPVQILDTTSKGERPEFPSPDVPTEKWRKLINCCWHQDPKQRPTFGQIVDLLESPEFVDDKVDIKLFNSYKRRISGSQFVAPGERLKKEADQGNADSQLEYALRLYNGFEVTRNTEEAKRYFELSAAGGNAEAQLYLSLIYAREGNQQKSVENLQKSLNAGCPEAYSNYAQQLIDQGKIDDSLQYLQYAIQRGSLSAFLAYGNICEQNGQYGSPDLFYGIASNYCHCLDTIGTYLPIDCKFYRCTECDIDICEGCAKCCHKDHSVVEVGYKNAFVCGCGRNHFVDKRNKKHCCIEFVGETKCAGVPVLYQHLFKCLDCCNEPDEYVCKSCAENCHSGHRIVDCGAVKGFCSCGSKALDYKNKCKTSYFVDYKEDQCSCQNGNHSVLQRWFQCMTCGLYGSEEQGVCISCAHNCHKEHI